MQKFEIQKVTINKSQNNIRLDKALTNYLNKYSRSNIKMLLLNHNVKKFDQTITDASYKVKTGEVYNIQIPTIIDNTFLGEDIPLNIIFEDDDILVVNKPAGMVTHPAPGNKENTLVNALIFYTNNNLSSINSKNRPGIVHRLDKETSGLIVIAKNNESHLKLSEQFKDHSIHRKYTAIVWGTPQNQTIKGYIERHKINRKKMSLNNQGKGKYSETSIVLKKNYKICSLIDCSLKTGRTHQIRLHLKKIGSPVIGDKTYGKNQTNKYSIDQENFNKFLLLKNFNRQALHAYTLGFLHPTSKKYIEFSSELPDDMLKLLEFISKY